MTLDLRDQLGDEELVVLERADRLAERLALLGVLEGLVEDLRGLGDVADGVGQPLLGSQFIMWTKPWSGSPIRFASGTRTSSKKSSAVSDSSWPTLSSLRPRLKPSMVGLDPEQRDAVSALGLRVGACRDDDQVGGVAVGDEGLGSVEDPVVAVAYGGGLQRREVGASGRLGHADGREDLAGHEARAATARAAPRWSARPGTARRCRRGCRGRSRATSTPCRAPRRARRCTGSRLPRNRRTARGSPAPTGPAGRTPATSPGGTAWPRRSCPRPASPHGPGSSAPSRGRTRGRRRRSRAS